MDSSLFYSVRRNRESLNYYLTFYMFAKTTGSGCVASKFTCSLRTFMLRLFNNDLRNLSFHVQARARLAPAKSTVFQLPSGCNSVCLYTKKKKRGRQILPLHVKNFPLPATVARDYFLHRFFANIKRCKKKKKSPDSESNCASSARAQSLSLSINNHCASRCYFEMRSSVSFSAIDS